MVSQFDFETSNDVYMTKIAETSPGRPAWNLSLQARSDELDIPLFIQDQTTLTETEQAEFRRYIL